MDKHRWSTEVAFLTHLGTFLFAAQCKCYEPLWSGMHPVQASWQRPSTFPLSNSRWNHPEDRLPSQLKWENRHDSLEITIGTILSEKKKTKKRSAKTHAPWQGCHTGRLPLPEVLAPHAQHSCHSNYHSHFLRKLGGWRHSGKRGSAAGFPKQPSISSTKRSFSMSVILGTNTRLGSKASLS